MYQKIIQAQTLAWTPLDFPGVFMRVLYQNAISGGMTVMTRMELGASMPEHFHTHADELVYVMSGDFIEAGATHHTGTFFVGAAGTTHGPHESRTGCVLLTTFSAGLDCQMKAMFVE